MKKLLVIIVVIAAVMGNAPKADAHEGQEVVRTVSIVGGLVWMGLPLLFLEPSGPDGSLRFNFKNDFSAAFAISSIIVGSASVFGAPLSIWLSQSPHDYALMLTVVGATSTGLLLTLPYTLTVLAAVSIPVAFVIDTLFLYGPYTGYRVSLGVDLIRLIPTIAPTILDTGYYSKGIAWGAVIAPAVWVFGLGVVGLALGDDDPLAINNDDGSTIRFSPLYSPDNTGFLIHYTY